ncbi:hypothetical protein B0H11DRAFT_2262703, partial [Mycena galericulata]
GNPLARREVLRRREQLEELQKRDWKLLSGDEKKAHTTSPLAHTAGASRSTKREKGSRSSWHVGRLRGRTCPVPRNPRCLAATAKDHDDGVARGYERASAIEQKMNPITGKSRFPRIDIPRLSPSPGISSEGYKGKGFVTSK